VSDLAEVLAGKSIGERRRIFGLVDEFMSFRVLQGVMSEEDRVTMHRQLVDAWHETADESGPFPTVAPWISRESC
jgi:hypothetical protein